MEVLVQQMTMNNFKAVRMLTINFAPETNIYSMNGGGKTTLLDGFRWNLFDKDSFDRKDFDIKPLDENNRVIRGLNPEVEVVLLVDGRTVTFKKVYSEKWVKKRGSATEEFTGHTTDYFVDGVPCKQSEYKSAVSRIVDEEIFKLLTSPTHFNTVLDWKKRRQILLDMCGDVSDEEVIAGNESLAKLPDILNERSIDDHRKVIAAKRRQINEELERIPVRIDEASRSKPDVSGLDEAILDIEIHGLRVSIDQLSAELIQAQNGVGVAELEKRLRQIDGEVLDIKNKAREAAVDSTESKMRKVHEIQSRVNQLQQEISIATTQHDALSNTISLTDREIGKLRVEWTQTNNEELADDGVLDACPTCNQPLPSEQVEAAKNKALANFKRNKSDKLERIAKQGQDLSSALGQLQSKLNDTATYTEKLTQSLQIANAELEAAKAELELSKVSVPSSEDSPELKEKLNEYERVSGELQTLRVSSKESVERIQSEIGSLRSQLAQKEQDKAKFAQATVIAKRIEDLKAQERMLAREFEQLEEQLYLTEEFIRAKVQMLESRINSKFKYARFKLFEQQINGGLSEVCETTYKGVPYGSGLNHAACIQVGIDICNTLSQHYGLTLPIWIDNRESVTDIVPTDSQVINLIVSPNDKTLRIESGLIREDV